MDITNDNFLSLLPQITATIHDCDFIAIDTELSGLMRERSLNRFDLPEERFAKAVETSRGYFIMQFGLSCFKRLEDNLKYSNRTYNFYIFPQPHKFHGDIDRTYSLQAHAIQFLTEHGFDFNKLFKHGVSYLTFQEKKLLTAQLKNEMKLRSQVEYDKNGVPKFVPATMGNYCREWIKKVNKFVEKRKAALKAYNAGLIMDSNSRMSMSTSGEDHDSEMRDNQSQQVDNRLEIRDANSNHARTVLKRVLECLPIAENLDVRYEHDPTTEERYLVVDFMDKKTKNAKQKNAIAIAKGFLEVIELIIVNKKPLVGHNLALDLIQIINQFMEPLSDDYDSFKETCHSLFPLIFDTKYIAHQILEPKTLTNNQSRLNDLYRQLRNSSTFPQIKMDHLGEFFDENQIPHQAGYDAYMSGYCFIALCEGYLKENTSKKHKQSKMEDLAKSGLPPLPTVQKVIDDFSNKIHLSYSYDFKYLYLSGDEHEPDRSHVFYIEFPSNWSLDDLFQMFHQYGGVEASKLSKTSALCALRDLKHVPTILKMAKNNSDSKIHIHTYSKYMENIKPRREADAGGDDGVDVSDA